MTISLDSFDFSSRSDVVEENEMILIPDGSFVSTLAGDDSISSVYTTDTPTISFPTSSEDNRETVWGIYNQGSFNTSSENDVVLGNIEHTGEFLFFTGGILNGLGDGFNFIPAIMFTGSGDDRVLGFGASSNSKNIIGIWNSASSQINTGEGHDEVIGEATGNTPNLIAGIFQRTSIDATLDATNLITTGNGDDKVIGKVINGRSDSDLVGIVQDKGNNQTITGNGNDQVIGEANGSATRSIIGIDQEDGNNQIITGNGIDEIIGEASGNASTSLIGIIQGGGNSEIITGDDNDKVIGKANGNLTFVSFQEDEQQLIPVVVGISQLGNHEISTGNGSDEVIGEASGTTTSDNLSIQVPIVGIAKLNSTIETGSGADKVIGKADGTAVQIAGIVQQGAEDLIITEDGNDEVVGIATGTTNDPNFGIMAGIAQQPDTAGSQIITEDGDDKVIGTADNDGEGLTAGILGDLDINTGEGHDEVIASAQLSGTRVDGFAADPITQGTVTVNTGSGNDLVKGFGQGYFDGGEGDGDIYDLSEYSQSEFAIEIGAGENNEVNFTHSDIFGESTASTQGFEVFLFADGELSFADLA